MALILAPAMKNSFSKTCRPASDENGSIGFTLGWRGSKGNFDGNAM
jgi:hypothetical protein